MPRAHKPFIAGTAGEWHSQNPLYLEEHQTP